jgi:hypothetical protein
MDLKEAHPVFVKINKTFKKASLHVGDIIIAEIYSDVDENGMTSDWHFKKIKKLQ